MKTQTLLLRYYKRRFYHGRSFIARAVDFLALRVITLAACYLWFTTLIDNTVMAAVLSLTALATISVAVELFKSLRLERFIQKERKRISERLFRERLLILPKEEFLAVVKAFLEGRRSQFADDCLVYTVQSALPVSEDTVLRAHRAAQRRMLTAAVIFSAAKPQRLRGGTTASPFRLLRRTTCLQAVPPRTSCRMTKRWTTRSFPPRRERKSGAEKPPPPRLPKAVCAAMFWWRLHCSHFLFS